MSSSQHTPPHAIRWLHVPKSGSSFVNVLARFGCRDTTTGETPLIPIFDIALNFSRWRTAHPEVRCAGVLPPWTGHAPAQPRELQGARVVLVGVFRRPAQRLLSGFHHREDGEADSMIAPGMPPATRAAMRRACRNDPSAYARWPGIAGCATKMLLGSPCAAERALRPSDVTRAVRVVRERFAFVGLLEHWATSVCVFHRTLLPSVPIDPAELRRTHPGPMRRPPPTSSSANTADAATDAPLHEYDERELHGFVDADDERVYAAASARFWADARRSGCAPPTQHPS